MFCDLEGFTSFVENLGPEEAYSMMDQIYEILNFKNKQPARCNYKVFIEFKRIRRKWKVEGLFSKSLFKKKRSRFTQHNQAHNITVISLRCATAQNNCNINMICQTIEITKGHLYS